MIPKGYVAIPVEILGLAFLRKIKDDLTIVADSTSSFKKEDIVHRLFVETSTHLGVPRGYYLDHLKPRGIEVPLKYSNGGTFTKHEREYQYRDGQEEVISKAVEICKEHGCGGCVIEAGVGVGKTLISLDVARRLGLKTLVIVHTTVLMEQWILEIKRFFPNWKVGRIQGSTIEAREYDICVAMLQSVSMKDDYPDWLYEEFGTIIVDECLHGDTLITTPSGSIKISDIKIGDTVVTPTGTAKVKSKKKTNKKAFKYSTSGGGYIIASEDHKVPNAISKWKTSEVRNRYTGRGVEYKDISISNATHLLVGDFEKPEVNTEPVYEFLGWFIGDGTIDKSILKFGFRKQEKIDALCGLLSELNQPFRKVKNTRGDTVITVSKFLCEWVKSFGFISGKKYPFIPKNLSVSQKISVIKGLIDTDGDVGTSVHVSSGYREILEEAMYILRSVGIYATVNTQKPLKVGWLPRHRLLIGILGCDIDLFLSLRVLSKRQKIKLKLQSMIKKTDHFGEAIVSVDDVGSCDLYDIEIDDEERIFIANGYRVHNCHLSGSLEFSKGVPRFTSRYNIGVSGTTARKDKCERVFIYNVGKILPFMDTIKTMDPHIYFIDTGFAWSPPSYMKNSALDRQRVKYLSSVTKDPKRNMAIVRQAVKAAKSGRRVLVLSERVDQLKELTQSIKFELQGTGLTAGMMIGETKQKDRDESQKADIILATVQLVGTGFNCPELSVLVFASPVQNVTQCVGRVTRLHPGKKTPMVLDFVDTQSGAAMILAKSRFRKYLEKGWKLSGYNCFGEEYVCRFKKELGLLSPSVITRSKS